MIRIIKYFVIAMFLGFMAISVFIMIDNYHLAVKKGVAQTIICEQVETSIQGSHNVKSVETCYTYNPQLLFYGQIGIIAVLILSMKYVYNLAISYIARYRKKRAEEENTLDVLRKNKNKNHNFSF